MPGIGDDIEGAMQQAPQPTRQCIFYISLSGHTFCLMYWDVVAKG